MAFFRNEPITDVVRRLSLEADGEAGMNLLARSAWEPPRWNGSSVRPLQSKRGGGTLPFTMGNRSQVQKPEKQPAEQCPGAENDLLEQEVWSMLLAYNLIRRETTKAAEKHKKAASEISFKFAFQFIATKMIVLGNRASPGTSPKRQEHLRGLWKLCS